MRLVGSPRAWRSRCRCPASDVWSPAMSGDEIPWDLPQAGDELAGQYEILGLIATGGTGVLLRARQKSLRRTVVVKFMIQVTQEPASAERFLREARAAGRISEPHVVNIYDCGFAAQGAGERDWVRAEAGIAFIVMEYMRGLDLAALMEERNAPLEVAETLGYMREACIGVAAIHRQGTVLRDLKPANLFLCATDSGRNVVKVTDFGISKTAPVDRGSGDVQVAARSGSLGSVSYMSPEQLSQPIDRGLCQRYLVAGGHLLRAAHALVAVRGRKCSGALGSDFDPTRQTHPRAARRASERSGAGDRSLLAAKPRRSLFERRGAGAGFRAGARPALAGSDHPERDRAGYGPRRVRAWATGCCAS